MISNKTIMIGTNWNKSITMNSHGFIKLHLFLAQLMLILEFICSTTTESCLPWNKQYLPGHIVGSIVSSNLATPLIVMQYLWAMGPDLKKVILINMINSVSKSIGCGFMFNLHFLHAPTLQWIYIYIYNQLYGKCAKFDAVMANVTFANLRKIINFVRMLYEHD